MKHEYTPEKKYRKYRLILPCERKIKNTRDTGYKSKRNGEYTHERGKEKMQNIKAHTRKKKYPNMVGVHIEKYIIFPFKTQYIPDK